MKNLKQKRVLLLEDNREFADNTVKLLELYFKEVIHCVSMKSALLLFNEEDIDMIISDLRVEDGIALDFIETIRLENLNVPIIVLSAHKDEELLFKAIRLNLTDYLIKPIDLEQFENVLKKASKQLKMYSQDIFEINSKISYNKNRQTIISDNIEYILSKKESIFIELLVDNIDKITTKDNIAYSVWQDKVMSESALKNFLLRLRKKIGDNVFINLHNIGYKLVKDEK